MSSTPFRTLCVLAVFGWIVSLPNSACGAAAASFNSVSDNVNIQGDRMDEFEEVNGAELVTVETRPSMDRNTATSQWPQTDRTPTTPGTIASSTSSSQQVTDDDSELQVSPANAMCDGTGKICHGTVVFYCNKKLRAVRRNKRCNLPCEDRQGNLYAHGETMLCLHRSTGASCSIEDRVASEGRCVCKRCHNAKSSYYLLWWMHYAWLPPWTWLLP